MLEIRKSHLSELEVKTLLEIADTEFWRPISTSLDIDKYSHKLSLLADFIVAKESGKNVGFIAYYRNIENSFLYVSFIWRSRLYTKKDIGKKMLDYMISQENGKLFKKVLLEVNKQNPALYFYSKNGFVIEEDRNNKYLMKLDL